ncbi:MAG: type I restriction enzyme HsdR N-terminal domain-containing protein [Bacteroidales bacterium]|nr:type I restriction enzyme HsdR N-terminal domain-containing protein [Bacteroidales bacterium]MDT8431533.1 type I restriction enzyme HsdR N-terminal domain-containing protein [Bacteroidales bacterium]
MQKLNLPEYDLKLKQEGGRTLVFDPFRSKYLVMTPEEQVRQLFARYLVEEKQYPASLMATEYALVLNKMSKRCDILVFDRNGKPVVLVECKSPDVRIGREVFDQVARYNMVFRVAYLLITNGLKHYCCRVDHEAGSVEFLDDIPVYAAL